MSKTLPEGFIEMVSCCYFCKYWDIFDDSPEQGYCSKHDIVVNMFNKCHNYED